MRSISMFCLLILGQPAFANSVAGPHLIESFIGVGAVESEDGATNHNLSKRHTDFKLLIPLPQISSNFQLVPQFHIAEESRKYDSDVPAIRRPFPTHNKMGDIGLIGAWANAERDMQIAFIAARYSRMSKSFASPAMAEFIGAVSLIEERANGVFRGAEAMAALRFRRFPHADRWLPLIGYKQRLGDWYYDILIPSHGFLAYDLGGGKNYGFVSAVLDGRQEEYDMFGSSYWAEGYATNVTVGWLRHLAELLYVRLDVGVQGEFLEVFARDNKKVDTYNFDFAPLLQISFVTHVDESRQ